MLAIRIDATDATWSSAVSCAGPGTPFASLRSGLRSERTASGLSCLASIASDSRSLRVSSALAATARASGSGISSEALSMRGMILGMKATASAGLSIILHMLSTIVHALRRMSVARSLSPRNSSGTVTASAGLLISWTKTVAASLWMHSGTRSGLSTHSMIVGANGARSRLSAVAVHASIALFAAAITSSLESHIASVIFGTASYSSAATSSLACPSARAFKPLSAQTLTGHLSCPIPSNNSGSSSRKACGRTPRWKI
mmetsp:Transcript_62955/g.148306  ORF Transcript_62955/g.148306 Transcript_62955/m.148306 type:complete len:258 (+) Transcript_62955:2082-2855(+)